MCNPCTRGGNLPRSTLRSAPLSLIARARCATPPRVQNVLHFAPSVPLSRAHVAGLRPFMAPRAILGLRPNRPSAGRFAVTNNMRSYFLPPSKKNKTEGEVRYGREKRPLRGLQAFGLPASPVSPSARKNIMVENTETITENRALTGQYFRDLCKIVSKLENISVFYQIILAGWILKCCLR